MRCNWGQVGGDSDGGNKQKESSRFWPLPLRSAGPLNWEEGFFPSEIWLLPVPIPGCSLPLLPRPPWDFLVNGARRNRKKKRKKGTEKKRRKKSSTLSWAFGYSFADPRSRTRGFLLDLLLHHCIHFQFSEHVEFVLRVSRETPNHWFGDTFFSSVLLWSTYWYLLFGVLK